MTWVTAVDWFKYCNFHSSDNGICNGRTFLQFIFFNFISIMYTSSCKRAPGLVRLLHSKPLSRTYATAAPVKGSKPEGDISSVFVSLSGREANPLPERFADQKASLIAGHEEQVKASWKRLLVDLEKEVRAVKELGPAIIPDIDFQDIERPPESFKNVIKKTGVAVVRNVFPDEEALKYKEEVRKYIKMNPTTKGMSVLNIGMIRLRND
jgi:hypothetical protein